MENRAFRFIREKDITNSDAIVMILGESYIQSFANSNFGRELSEVELNRFSTIVWDNEDAVEAINQLMNAVIEDITNPEDNDWLDTDQSFLEELPPDEKAECLKEQKELTQS